MKGSWRSWLSWFYLWCQNDWSPLWLLWSFLFWRYPVDMWDFKAREPFICDGSTCHHLFPAQGDIHVSFWPFLAGFFSTFLGLLLSPYVNRLFTTPKMCFLDLVSIHQTDQAGQWAWCRWVEMLFAWFLALIYRHCESQRERTICFTTFFFEFLAHKIWVLPETWPTLEQELMERGIYGLGGFLQVSKELRVLWSAPYLSRLWSLGRDKIP